MSKTMYFHAFRQSDINEFLADNSAVSVVDYINAEAYEHSTEIENIWDVLQAMYDNDTNFISGGTAVHDDSGMTFLVKTHQDIKYIISCLNKLTLTDDAIMERFRTLKDNGIYKWDDYQDAPEEVVDSVNHIAQFYMEAALEGLGVVSYLETS